MTEPKIVPVEPDNNDLPLTGEIIMAHGGRFYLEEMTREDAFIVIEKLQRQFDITDKEQEFRALIDAMEERHGESFNAFYEATLLRVMLSNNLTQVTVNTDHFISELANGHRPLILTEMQGAIVYSLPEEYLDDTNEN